MDVADRFVCDHLLQRYPGLSDRCAKPVEWWARGTGLYQLPYIGQLGDTPPQLTLDILPDSVRAGSRQVFTVTVTHPDMVVAGIQTVIRPGDDELHYVGQLQSDKLTTLMKDGISYLNHTKPFRAVSGAVTLTIVWEVPDTSGSAILNTAMVAANEDGTPFGDSVVKTERTIQILADDK